VASSACVRAERPRNRQEALEAYAVLELIPEMTASESRPFALEWSARFLDLPAYNGARGWPGAGLAGSLEERLKINRQRTHRRWQLG